MVSPVQRYQQEMHQNIGFFATWLPGDLLELGDIGTLVNGTFRKQSSFKEMGIAYEVSKFGASQNLQYTSKFGIAFSVDTSVDASAMIDVSAAIKVEFSSQGSFLFQASDVRNRRLENIANLKNAVLEARASGKWNKNWQVVDSIREADCATVIVSEDESARVSFNAKGPVGGIPLADPRVNLSISSSRGRMAQVIAGRHIRPLYTCLHVRESLFSSPSFEPVRGAAGGDAPFVKTSINELLQS